MQAWEAQQLLNRANRLRPLRGPDAQARFALRMGGIIAAVKGGRVGNSAFGRKLHGHRGGKVMARHALHHLRAIAPLGSQAAAAKRQAQKAPQETQDTLPRLERTRGGHVLGRGDWRVLARRAIAGASLSSHSVTRRVRMRYVKRQFLILSRRYDPGGHARRHGAFVG